MPKDRKTRLYQIREYRGKPLEPGEHYADENQVQLKQVRVDFVSNGVDSYEFNELNRYKTFENLLGNPPLPDLKALRTNVNRYLGEHVGPMTVQSISMPYVLNAEYDVSIRAQAGCGKTLAYAVPIVYNTILAINEKGWDRNEGVYALIVVPESSLCDQVYGVFCKLCNGTKVKVSLSYPNLELKDVRNKYKNEGVDIFICTYQHLDHYFLDSDDLNLPDNDEKWSLESTRYVVLDEAYELIGGGFQCDQAKSVYYQHIEPLALALDIKRKAKNDYSLIMVSPNPEISQYVDFPYRPNGCVYIEFGDEKFSSLCIELKFIEVLKQEDKWGELDKLLDELRSASKQVGKEGIPRAIIFAKSCNVEHIFHHIFNRFGGIVSYSHKDSKDEKPARVNKFKEGSFKIFVIDDSLIGSDIPDVEFVINYDLPDKFSDFETRAGRCGRLGNAGRVISFFNKIEDWVFAFGMNQLAEKMPSFEIPEFVKQCGILKSKGGKFVPADGNGA